MSSGSRVDDLMRVFEVLSPLDGWVCTGLTNRKILLSHPAQGRRVCWIDGGGRVAVRAPGEKDRVG